MTPPRPRISLVHQGDPTHGRTWSGTTLGLATGLAEVDCEVVPVNASPPSLNRLAGAMRMSWLDEATNPVLATASSAVASAALRRAGRLDGVIMIGSGYRLWTRVPTVTFEDMTAAQVLRHPSVAGSVSDRAAERWLRRQRAAYEHSVACCVCSHWAADSVRDDYGVPAAKISVVGLGTNAVVSPPAERDWSVPRFLFIGVEWERKRGPAVVEAFAEVRRRHPGATLDLVGGHPPIEADGVTGHGLLPLDSEAGQRKLTSLLEAATCFVMPSAIEPYGIAYLDAARAGIASIGTAAGGAPDAIGEGGLVVDPEDQAGLVAAMDELADPETARRLGERALARAPENSWAAVARRVIASLLAGPAGAAQTP